VIVHTVLLPRLQLPTLRYHGQAPDPNPTYVWLFLEDAGEIEWDDRTGALVAEWAGRLHTGGVGLSDIALPELGPAHYLRHLRDGFDRIMDNMGNPSLTPAERATLEQALAAQASLAKEWEHVASLCDPVPTTIVHGDLVPKNVRVKTTPWSIYVAVLDWETAGRGPLAPDLPKIGAIDTYLETIQTTWPHVDHEMLNGWMATGRLFRLLAAIDWESDSLPYAHVERAVRRIAMYLDQLRDCTAQLGLSTKF